MEVWRERLAAAERQLIDQLARPDEKERAERMAFGVTPLLCGIVTAAGSAESGLAPEEDPVEAAEDDEPVRLELADPAPERASGDPGIVNAISIRQPFVELILRGEKTVECRSKPTRMRRRVYLYASQTPSDDDEAWESVGKAPGELPVGLILGSVEIVDCLGEDGEYEYVLERPERFAVPLRPRNQPQPVFWRPVF